MGSQSLKSMLFFVVVVVVVEWILLVLELRSNPGPRELASNSAGF